MKTLILYISFLKINLKKFIEYPANLISLGVGSILTTAIYLVIIILLFKKNVLAGYHLFDMMILLGYFLFYDSLLYLTAGDLFYMNNLILDGGYIESVVTKPISPLFHILLKGHSFGEIPNLLFSILIIVIATISGEYFLSGISILLLILIQADQQPVFYYK